MFIRVYDYNRRFYNAMVYAVIGDGWCKRYVIADESRAAFMLIDSVDKGSFPPSYHVEVLQSDFGDFDIYPDKKLSRFDGFCKENGIDRREFCALSGYPDVCNNYDFITDVFLHKCVPMKKYPELIRPAPDFHEWTQLRTQEDADRFMLDFSGLHGYVLDKLVYSEEDFITVVNMLFLNVGDNRLVELCFDEIERVNLLPPPENGKRLLSAPCLIVENGSVFWADRPMDAIDDAYTGSMVKAHHLKWRTVQ